MDTWNSSASCEHVVQIEPSRQCAFVHEVLDCQNTESFINYLSILYCTSDDTAAGGLAITQLAVLLIILFVLLGTTAGEYLCPALVNISRTLKMSQSVAGVTLLAFGNGAPDVVSTIAGVAQNRSSLVAGELFGGALYICTTVIGLLFILSDFDVPLSLFRDVIFYLAASFWAQTLFRRGYVELRDALGFLLLYATYLVVAVVLPSVVSKLRHSSIFKKVGTRSNVSASDDGYASERSDEFIYEPMYMTSPAVRGRPPVRRKLSSSLSLHRHLENAICTLTTNAQLEHKEQNSLARSGGSSICEVGQHALHCPTRTCKIPFYVSSLSHQETTPLLSSSSIQARSTQFIFPRIYSEWQELILRLWPVETDDWKSMSCLSKCYHVLVYPILLPLVFTIPVVDEHHRRSNWNRPLNVFQCIVAPLVVLALTKNVGVAVLPGIPLWSICLAAGCLLGMVVLGSSTNRRPPRYFVAFPFLGFALSLVWIYRLATEVVSILKALGIYFAISEEVLGASVLTWGNYLGDLVTNLSIASQGYPEMALNACLSTSLVALLIGIGTAFTTRFITSGALSLTSRILVQSSNMLDAIYIALLASIAVLSIGICVARLRASRVVGIVLVSYYVIFLLVIFSKEFGLLQLLFH